MPDRYKQAESMSFRPEVDVWDLASRLNDRFERALLDQPHTVLLQDFGVEGANGADLDRLSVAQLREAVTEEETDVENIFLGYRLLTEQFSNELVGHTRIFIHIYPSAGRVDISVESQSLILRDGLFGIARSLFERIDTETPQPAREAVTHPVAKFYQTYQAVLLVVLGAVLGVVGTVIATQLGWMTPPSP